MNRIANARNFRLRPEGIHCDAEGLRVGEIPLLARDASGAWTPRETRDVNPALSRRYGLPIDIAAKDKGLRAVAAALGKGEIARAQIAALLLQLPDPPPPDLRPPDEPSALALARELAACGLLKADADWDEAHPRTGEAPNPGWFAPKPRTAPESETAPATDAPPAASDDDASSALVAPALDAGPWLGSELTATALEGLATLASRFAAPAILFNAIFVPSQNAIVDQGPVPGQPDMTFRWAHDEAQVTFNVVSDGQSQTFAVGALKSGDIFVDSDGEIVARLVMGPAGKPILVTTADALDRALVEFRSRDGAAPADAVVDDHAPKLCPDPTPEAKTSTSQNSILYQQYVTGLPYGWAINVGGVRFDGCDEATGILLEAKANIDHLFDNMGKLFVWVNPKNDPALQMEAQYEAAKAAGRIVVWHAQTLKTYQGLLNIKNKNDWPNLLIVLDPN